MKNTKRFPHTWALGALAIEVAFLGCNALAGLDQNYQEVSCIGASCSEGGPDASSSGSGGATCATEVLNATGPTGTPGACDYASCLPGFGDVDGDRSNGCESVLPTGVPEASSLVLWLRGEDWDGSTWTDQSPGERNAKTYFGTVGIGTFNGHRVAAFDGNGVLLIDTGFPDWFGLTIMTMMNAPDANGALIAMGTSYGGGDCAGVPPYGTSQCQDWDMLEFDTSMKLEQCDPNITDCWQAWPASTTGAGWVRLSGAATPGANPSYRAYLNGTDEGTFPHNRPWPYPAPWPTPRKDAIVGWGGTPSNMFSGQIGEMIIYNTPLSDTSRLALDAYLHTKWGI